MDKQDNPNDELKDYFDNLLNDGGLSDEVSEDAFSGDRQVGDCQFGDDRADEKISDEKEVNTDEKIETKPAFSSDAPLKSASRDEAEKHIESKIQQAAEAGEIEAENESFTPEPPTLSTPKPSQEPKAPEALPQSENISPPAKAQAGQEAKQESEKNAQEAEELEAVRRYKLEALLKRVSDAQLQNHVVEETVVEKGGIANVAEVAVAQDNSQEIAEEPQTSSEPQIDAESTGPHLVNEEANEVNEVAFDDAANDDPQFIDEPLAQVPPAQVPPAEDSTPNLDTASISPESGAEEINYENPALAWHENGRPLWAQTRFDALVFYVSGLRLAVPLITLGKIEQIEDKLNPVFGQAEWLMGLFVSRDQKIRTVNTALFVMPERYDPKFLETAEYIVTIAGLPWGLAIDSIDKVIPLEPEQVNWRTSRSKRPWLAGTVKEQMCAILDINTLGETFRQAEKPLK